MFGVLLAHAGWAGTEPAPAAAGGKDEQEEGEDASGPAAPAPACAYLSLLLQRARAFLFVRNKTEPTCPGRLRAPLRGTEKLAVSGSPCEKDQSTALEP